MSPPTLTDRFMSAASSANVDALAKLSADSAIVDLLMDFIVGSVEDAPLSNPSRFISVASSANVDPTPTDSPSPVVLSAPVVASAVS